jgi:hypothetical protein
MDAEATAFVERLQTCFRDLPDPRVQGRCDHLLIDVLAIAILGVLCGAEDWPDIEEFGKRRAPSPATSATASPSNSVGG